MVDIDTSRKPGQALLEAYRAHAGPSPEALERLTAALRADIAQQGAGRGATPPEYGRIDRTGARRGRGFGDAMNRAASTHTRQRWVLGVGLLAMAAALGLLTLGPSLTPQGAHRGDSAASFHHEPAAPGSTRSRTHAVTPPAVLPLAVERGLSPQSRVTDAPRGRTPDSIVSGSVESVQPSEPALLVAEPALAAEMRLMRPAQLALDVDGLQEALALLEAYAQAFPNGRLQEEYLALWTIARCKAGPEGRAESAAFLHERPQSMFAGRVRNACDPR